MAIYRFPWGEREDAQVLIVDFRSKSTPLIAQILREIGLTSRILDKPKDLTQALKRRIPNAIILSGGPAGVYEDDAPHINRDLIIELNKRNVYFIGICYGAQLLAQAFGGIVKPAKATESGITTLKLDPIHYIHRIFGNYTGGQIVMNHGDEVTVLPEGWFCYGSTPNCRNAIFGRSTVFGMQFHPEMDHTENGDELFRQILLNLAECRKDYLFDPMVFTEEAGRFIKESVGEEKALVGFSGGVDSATCWALAKEALKPDQIQAVCVDNGFWRDGEMDEIKEVFGGDNICFIDAREQFYSALEKIPYPRINYADAVDHCQKEARYYEALRKCVGKTFIQTFTESAKRLGKISFLMQGTNNSDIQEDKTCLKIHHNVGGLPKKINFNVVEPLAGIYKMEIREVANFLDLPPEIVWRQPSPGPGNSIRTSGPFTRAKIRALAKANRILEEIVRKHYPDYSKRPCQYFVELDPTPETGLVGDKTTYGYALKVRAVASRNRESYATLQRFDFVPKVLDEISWRLSNEVVMEDGTRFVDVSYKISGKPPSTTERH